jgi:hypothetical protein
VEFHGHGWTVHDLAGLAVFSESPVINGSFGIVPDCQSRTEINGNLRILIEITRKFVTLMKKKLRKIDKFYFKNRFFR